MNFKRIDKKTIPQKCESEIRMFMVVRNESLRLPFVLDYYFDLGVDRIIIIDNGSTDNTQKLLLGRSNVHVFYTEDNFKDHGDWIRKLLLKYGIGCWSLVMDADELLIYPYHDQISLRQLVEFLDQENYKTVHCLLLDLYPDKALNDVHYKAGTNPVLIANMFDPISHHCKKVRYYGGVRERVFGVKPCLSKFSLLRVSTENIPSDGMHAVSGDKIACFQGVVLHFKYLQDFHERVVEEVKRGQHWNDASEYKAYAGLIAHNPRLTMKYDGSLQYKNWKQLEELGLIKTSSKLKKFLE